MKRLDKIYLGTNTKMYKTIKDTVEFLEKLAGLTADNDGLMELSSFLPLRRCITQKGCS